ncbi:hypothetical protein RMATCC62417_11721 [Rhizopus microsporus]|nr:hypothetical protein RMATCC62417_11721 [Rhizopus microsporus]
MVTLVAESVHSETEPKKVPAPIPAVNVWQVNKLNTPQTSAVNDDAWPAPVEALKQQEVVPEKSISTKSISKGQWKPLTPTIIHSSLSKRDKNDKKSRQQDRKDVSQDKNENSVPETQFNRSYALRGGSRRPGRGRGRADIGFRRPFKPYQDADTLKSYILQQIEYYFSIDNLCKDLYLRSQMNTEGYVPISLIAGFNRIKNLTVDMDLVRASLQLSELLEINQDATMLRRKEGWEMWILPAKKTTKAQSNPQPEVRRKSIQPEVRRKSIQEKPQKEDHEEDLFDFEDEEWIDGSRPNTIKKYYISDEEEEDDEFDDDKVARIMIVTQHKRDRTHQHYDRAKMNDDILDMINEGLYQYEAGVGRKTQVSQSKIGTLDPEHFKKQKEDAKPTRFYPVQPESLPANAPIHKEAHVGWVLSDQPYHPSGDGLLSTSLGKSPALSTSLESNMAHSFGSFQHPSHELLRDKFVQHKYHKYHAKALKERKQLGVGQRPHIAKYVFDEHDTTPTGFLWSNSDELLSVSKDKWFIKQNIKRAYQPVDLLKRNGMGWNVHGDIAFTIDRSERSSFVDESLIPKAPKNWKKLGVRTSFDEEAIQYVPPQSCGIAHMPLFDFKAFCIFAEKYVISNDNIAFACDQNAELAWKMGRYRTSQTWRIIALLYSEQEKDVENKQLEVESIEEAKIKEERQHNEVQDSIDSYEQLSQSSGYTDSLNTTLSQTQVQFSPQTPWQHDATVMDLFNYYTEQGDVQMCVTLYLVLEKYLDIDENRLEDWFTAYIDLLHRFKLWSTATAIIKACKVQNVRERNENATTINIACNTCFKLVQGTSNGAWACDKCHRLLNPCTIW